VCATNRTQAVLNAVAAVPDDAVTFESVVEPLMAVPHYKTNKAVCESKFLQHCSTDPELRAAADQAGATSPFTLTLVCPSQALLLATLFPARIAQSRR
jgi:hypothetical protein